MKEDALTKALVKKYNEKSQLWDKRIVKPEEHYNHYGDRGVVDLFIRQIQKRYADYHVEDRICEIKADVEDIDRCNPVIRQFKRMVEYFYKGTSHDKADTATFELTFIPNERTILHVLENLDIYREVQQSGQHSLQIVFRHPANLRPIHICPSGVEEAKLLEPKWWEYCEDNNEKIHSIFQDVVGDEKPSKLHR